ncbi:unnamed protein product [Spirodela intermedia]|uniref:Uncharacterized protein n=2 Tax=Spirodela intermedia TaxID=51605 RepID=A0A7I8KHS3_SPIIN|nr:unnamed protein product [Spirodela intermedia]CAA6660292.1 unnamed protein product [Spirodela intermedia]CAA7396628.1 unnamed protein product [Spirodela intermedia]
MVRRLAELGLTVVLTSRDVGKGMAAVEELRAGGLRVAFRQLDVSDEASIQEFASWLRQTFHALDILVNNAAVSFNDIGENSVAHAEAVIRTNFHGPKRLTEALLPLFRRFSSHSRILNISSQLGLLSEVKNEGLRAMLKDEEGLSEAAIEDMVAAFLGDVKEGTWRQRGWPRLWTDYSVSKLALNAYTRLLARKLEGARISVNCFCPGFTRTDMTRGRGERTAEEAADVAATLVLLPAAKLPTGRFFKWCTPILYSAI